MKKLIFLIILALSFTLILASCDAFDAIIGGKDKDNDTDNAYSGELADVYNALKAAGYGGTPEDFIAHVKARMAWHGYTEADKEFTAEIVNGELILTFPDGTQINCGTAVFEENAAFVSVNFTNDYPHVSIPRGTAIGTLPEPTRVGYTFGGWFKIEDYNNGSFDNEILADTKIYENITLAPRWIRPVEDDGTKPAELLAVYKNDKPLEDYYPRIHIGEFTYNYVYFYFAYDEEISSYEISLISDKGTLNEHEIISAPGWQDAVSSIRVKFMPADVGIHTIRVKVTDKDGNKTVSETNLHVFNSSFLPPYYGMADHVGVSTTAGGSESFEDITLVYGKKQKLYFTFSGNIEGLSLAYHEKKVTTYKVGDYLVAEFEVISETPKGKDFINLEAVQTVNGRTFHYTYTYEVTVDIDTDVKVIGATYESDTENIYRDGKINLEADRIGTLYIYLNVDLFKVLYNEYENEYIAGQMYDTGDNRIEVRINRTAEGEFVLPVTLIVVQDFDGYFEYSEEFEIEIAFSISGKDDDVEEEEPGDRPQPPSKYEIFDVEGMSATYNKQTKTLTVEEYKLDLIYVLYPSTTRVIESAYLNGNEVPVMGSVLDAAGNMSHHIFVGILTHGTYELKLVLVNSQVETITLNVTKLGEG